MASVDVIKTISPSGEEDDVLSINNTDAEEVSYTFGNILNFSGEYTFSCWMKSTSTNFDISVHISNVNHSFTITNEWQRIIYTGQANVAESREVLFTVPSGFNLYAYQGQLEKGTIATDFSINQQDVLDNITDVDGKINVLQTNFNIQQGQIDALIKDTTINGVSLKDKYLETVATVDGISTTINSLETSLDGLESKTTSIETTVNGVKTEVVSASTLAGESKTLAEQNSNKISWLVKSGTDETNFTLTNRTAELVANEINLNGLVTFGGLDKETQDKINEASGDVEIGGRNLLYDSSFPTNTKKWHFTEDKIEVDTLTKKDGNNSVKIINCDRDRLYVPNEYLSEYDIGRDLVLTFWLKVSDVTKITNGATAYIRFLNKDYGTNDKNYKVITKGAFENAGSNNWFRVEVHGVSKDVSHVYCTFVFAPKDSEAIYYIASPKLEYGTQPTDWSSAPDDKANQSTIDAWGGSEIKEGITQINGGYIQTNTITASQLVVEDIFSTGSAAMNIINAQEINADRITSGTIKSNFLELYGLNVLQKDTDKVTLAIDTNGDITMRGTVESYNYITGQSGWSIRNDGNAEFNDVIVRGSLIGNDSGVIGGLPGEESSPLPEVRFWAGSDYGQRESAPFIVYNDGSVKATKGEFGGVFSGTVEIGNISIVDPSKLAGGDALLTIQNGQNGIKRVQLRDTDSSSFAQNIIIADNMSNTMVTLSQDGTGIFTQGVYAGSSNTSLKNNELNLNGNYLSSNSDGFYFDSSQVRIGTNSQNSFLKVEGNIETSGDLKVKSTINFNDIAIFKVSKNGLDINVLV